jgi:hypothetical protein
MSTRFLGLGRIPPAHKAICETNGIIRLHDLREEGSGVEL